MRSCDKHIEHVFYKVIQQRQKTKTIITKLTHLNESAIAIH